MGKLRKIGRKIKKGFKSLGKKLKRGLGKIAKAFGKLGPLGSIALSFLLPGMGSVLSGWLGQMGPVGEFILNIGSKIQKGANWVKNGVGRVFNKVTDAIEYGMNAVSKPFMKEGARGMGSAFRDFVSEQTGGFIDRSKVGLTDDMGNAVDISKLDLSKDLKTGKFNTPEDAKYLSDLQDRNKFMRDVNKFESKGIEGLTKRSTDTGFEYYKTGKDGALLDKPYKTIVDKSTLPFEAEVKKPSMFAEGEYDSFRDRVKSSREFDMYEKLGPVTSYGQGILQDESDAAYANYLMKQENAQRAGVIAEETLSMVPTNTYAYAPQDFIDINNLNNNPNAMAQMTSGYGLILEDFYVTT